MTGKAVEFEFRTVDSAGLDVGMSREKGSHDETTLTLGTTCIPDQRIRTVVTKGEVIRLSWCDDDGAEQEVGFLVCQKMALPVRDSLHRTLSRRIAASIVAENQNREPFYYHEHECFYCQSLNVTTQPNPSPQVFCTYCDSINTLESSPEITNVEMQYRLCDSCNMYSRPRQFSVFYFFDLIGFGGVHHKVTNRCPACMRRDAWLMFFGNLPFILGVPVAVTQLYRVYHDSIRRGPFRGLDEANVLFKRGKIEKALDRYYKIIDRHPVSAGVLYNIARGLMVSDDFEHAHQVLEMSLENCSNYRPSIDMLEQCQARLEG